MCVMPMSDRTATHEYCGDMGYARDEPERVMQSHTHIHAQLEIEKIGQDLHFIKEHAGPKISDDSFVVLFCYAASSRRTKSFL